VNLSKVKNRPIQFTIIRGEMRGRKTRKERGGEGPQRHRNSNDNIVGIVEKISTR